MKKLDRPSDSFPRFSLIVLILLLLQSCATTLNQRLDQKLALETGITTRQDLKNEAAQWIQDSTSLSADQKQRLDALKNTASTRMDEIHETSLKLRSILITDLLQGSSPAEVSLIQDRLKVLERRRFELIFQSAARAGDILGRADIDQEWVNQALFFPHGGGN